VGYGVEMVQCTQPEGAFRGIIGCRVARPTEVRAACPGFESPTPGAELYPVPARSPAVTPGSRRPATTPSSWSRWSPAQFRVAWRARAEDPVPQRQSGRCHAGRSPLEVRTSGGSDRVP
jgi:hypothetical protein